MSKPSRLRMLAASGSSSYVPPPQPVYTTKFGFGSGGATTSVGVYQDHWDAWNSWSGHNHDITMTPLFPGITDSSTRLVQLGGHTDPLQRTGAAASGLPVVFTVALVPTSVNKTVKLTINSNATGSFTLSMNSTTSSAINISSLSASAIQSAVQSLSGVGSGNALVTQLLGASRTYKIEFVGSIARTNPGSLTVNTGGLSGGSATVQLMADATPTSQPNYLDATNNGYHDAAFTHCAQQVKDYGFTNVIWRIGHECNGDWYLWTGFNVDSGGNTTGNSPAKYISAYRRAVSLMRAVDSTAKYEFNCADTYTSNGVTIKYDDMYPGNDVVDYCGIDEYPNTFSLGANTGVTDAQVWNQSKVKFDYIMNFAKARNKAYAVSEYSVMARLSPSNKPYGWNKGAWLTSAMNYFYTNNWAYAINFKDSDQGWNRNVSFGETFTMTASAGSSTVTVNDGTVFFPGGGQARYIIPGTSSYREIDYTGVSGNTLTGVPTSGHGSVPSGGISAVQVARHIGNRCEIAVGTNDSDIEGTPYKDDPHNSEAAAAYRAFFTNHPELNT